MERILSPIILFLYNRPWHSTQTLDALAKNEMASESVLYVFCDGPKVNSTQDERESIENTRKIAEGENRFKEIILMPQIENKGLANSIIDGVTEVVNKHGKVIVLEDDILTSPGFLKYMNDALDMYAEEDKVMHISGYINPINETLPETFFFSPTTCWGWATWSASWKSFEKNAVKQIHLIGRKGWKKFTVNNSVPDYKLHLELNREGIINTWAIFWYASVFLKGGTSLHPYPSLVRNIGLDGTGVHCGSFNDNSNPYYWPTLAESIEVKKISTNIDKKVQRILINYFKGINKIKRELSFRDKFYLFRKSLFVNKLKK